jgi:hypothetical protein
MGHGSFSHEKKGLNFEGPEVDGVIIKNDKG